LPNSKNSPGGGFLLLRGTATKAIPRREGGYPIFPRREFLFREVRRATWNGKKKLEKYEWIWGGKQIRRGFPRKPDNEHRNMGWSGDQFTVHPRGPTGTRGGGAGKLATIRLKGGGGLRGPTRGICPGRPEEERADHSLGETREKRASRFSDSGTK